MIIDKDTCVGCGRCRKYCTMGCIDFARLPGKGRIVCDIDQHECVDCGICLRSDVCPTDSLSQPAHEFPRSLRATFSNPLAEHKETRVPGRGTEEMKTNDITGRYRLGYAGMAAEMGRPGVGARMRDVEKVFKRLAQLGVEFEEKNPLTALLRDRRTGEMLPEVLDEKVLSCIIEMIVPLDVVGKVLTTLDSAAREIDTLFSVDLTSRVDADGNVPTQRVLDELGRWYSKAGKTNMGLGKLQVKGAGA